MPRMIRELEARPRAAAPLLLAAAVALLGLATPSPAAAAEGFDLRAWLDRPGTRLIAVEFYATWCVPCMAAVPRWKALHDRYRDRGLRLVVINTQDPDGACRAVGWTPDEVVCDLDGRLYRGLGVGKLPAAFLWSWQGNLLVRQGHVAEIEQAVRRYLRRSPRVVVQVEGRGGRASKDLEARLRTKLGEEGKLTVVATDKERAVLAKLRRRSRSARFDDAMQCELGKEVSANSLLKAGVTGAKGRKRLTLSLLSAERGCLSAAATVPWDRKRPGNAVAEAVDKLLAKLKVPPRMPGGKRQARAETPFRREAIGETYEQWDAEETQLSLVRFESEPPGAVVMADGRLLCSAAPCQKSLALGSHLVEMQKESYLPARRTVTVSSGMGPVALKLEPDFGWLTVRSTPAGLPVTVDGTEVSRSPLQRHRLAPGGYEVLVQDPRYYDKGERVRVARGKETTVDVQLQPREGLLVVIATVGESEVAAEVTLDGAAVGRTPLSRRVLIGKHTVDLAYPGHKPFREEVVLAERRRANVVARLAGTTQVVFNEQFDDNRKGWATGTTADYQATIRSGHYHLKRTKPEDGARFNWRRIKLGDRDRIEVETELAWASGAKNRGFGLGLAGSGLSVGYVFEVTANGHLAFGELVSGTWKPALAWTKSPHVRRGAAKNRLKVRYDGSRFTLFVNDHQVGNVPAGALPGDHFGVRVNGDVGIMVDWLVVRKLAD